MKTSKTKYLIAVLTALVGLGLLQAQAHLLDPQQFTLASPLGSGTSENTYLINNGYLPATSQYLGKFEKDGTHENGAIQISNYVTVTMVSASTWDISWNLTGSGFTLDGVLIKDGVESPGNQLYRFYGVSADETLIGSGTVTFDHPVKGISHISFFGSPGGVTTPDGGTTAALLGLALTGLAGLRAKFGRN
jgi:hypothetical protein